METMRTPPVVGIDVGGTLTKAVLMDPAGTVLAQLRAPTPRSTTTVDDVVELAGELVTRLADAVPAGKPPAAVGFVVPGLVDEARGVAIDSKNLGWRDVPFARLVAERTGLPVAFGHDVRAGGLAEHRFGAAAGFTDVVFLPIGTGIAASLVIGGQPLTGGGYAGEIGHVRVSEDDEPCPCGLTGCLEVIASAAAIGRRYTARAGRTADAAEVARLVQTGDHVAVAVWNEAVDALARALCWIAAVIAPEAVVIGGGLAEADGTLFGPLRQRIDAGLSFHRRPRVLPAALGDRAGSLGAALLAAGLAGT
jgi:glucokinase